MEADARRQLKPTWGLQELSGQTQSRSSCTFGLSKVLSRRLYELAETAHVTPFAALLALFSLGFPQYSEQHDSAPRGSTEAFEEDGPWSCFIRRLKVRLSADQSFVELLDGIENLVRSEVDRETNTEPLVEILFFLPDGVQNRAVRSRSELTITNGGPRRPEARLVLSFTGPEDSQVTGVLEYANGRRGRFGNAGVRACALQSHPDGAAETELHPV